ATNLGRLVGLLRQLAKLSRIIVVSQSKRARHDDRSCYDDMCAYFNVCLCFLSLVLSVLGRSFMTPFVFHCYEFSERITNGLPLCRSRPNYRKKGTLSQAVLWATRIDEFRFE